MTINISNWTAHLGIVFKHTGQNVLRRQKCRGWAVLRCLLWPSLFRVLYAYGVMFDSPLSAHSSSACSVDRAHQSATSLWFHNIFSS
jgi:hypothetical protein